MFFEYGECLEQSIITLCIEQALFVKDRILIRQRQLPERILYDDRHVAQLCTPFHIYHCAQFSRIKSFTLRNSFVLFVTTV